MGEMSRTTAAAPPDLSTQRRFKCNWKAVPMFTGGNRWAHLEGSVAPKRNWKKWISKVGKELPEMAKITLPKATVYRDIQSAFQRDIAVQQCGKQDEIRQVVGLEPEDGPIEATIEVAIPVEVVRPKQACKLPTT